MAEKKTVVTIDPSLEYQRKLSYMEKNSGWEIFKAIYWSIYIFVMGATLFSFVPAVFSHTEFLGFAVMVLAMFYIVYAFVLSMHFRSMKRDA